MKVFAATLALGLALVQSPGQTPAPDSTPLPDLATLMAAVQQHEKHDEAVEKDYIFRSTTHFGTTQKDGSVKPRFSEVQEIYWSDGARVLRTIERDGKPLTPDEQQKEAARIEKRAAERKKKQDKQASKPDEAIPLSRLLELGSFMTPRREMVNGRPTIAVDFVGNPDAKTRNDNEKIIHEVAGTVWIDERDHTVQHLEGRLLKDFKVGGGLVASIGKGTTFSESKLRVNDEVWLPDHTLLRGHFRLLLLLATTANLEVANSDFRKFRTTSTVLPNFTSVDPAVPEGSTQPLDAAKAPAETPK